MPPSPGRRWRPGPARWPKASGRACAHASGVRARKAWTWSAFSAARIEQVAYSSTPPGRSTVQVASSRRACSCSSASRSAARRCSRMSGCRRTTPVAEHGASSRIASKLKPSHQSAGKVASAARTCTRPPATGSATPERRRFSSIRGSRRGSRSRASSSSSGSRSSRCTALPPGAAQASRTRAPCSGASASAACCAEPSWTETRPSPNPGSSCTGSGSSRRRASSRRGSICALMPAACNRARYSWREPRARLTRSHSGAGSALAANTAAACPGQSAWTCSRSHCGQAAAGSAGGKPSRWARRSRALTSPAWCGRPSARAASTVASRAACAGRPRPSSWAQPASSRASRGPSFGPGGFCSQPSSAGA